MTFLSFIQRLPATFLERRTHTTWQTQVAPLPDDGATRKLFGVKRITSGLPTIHRVIEKESYVRVSMHLVSASMADLSPPLNDAVRLVR